MKENGLQISNLYRSRRSPEGCEGQTSKWNDIVERKKTLKELEQTLHLNGQKRV